MLSMASGLRSDPLFGGLARPPVLLGLPIQALLFITSGSAVAYLVANMLQTNVMWKIGALGSGIVLYGIARLICAKDPRAFRYLGLQLNTKAMHRTRGYWRAGSYSPLPHRKRR